MVKFEQNVKINAPAETVWSVVSDPKKWPLWLSGVEQVTELSGLQSGATFQWKGGNNGGSGTVVQVDAENYVIKLALQEGDTPVYHTFDADRRGGFFGIGGNDAGLRYILEYDPPGGFLGEFVVGGNPKDALRVKNTLAKVKDLAEGQAGR